MATVQDYMSEKICEQIEKAFSIFSSVGNSLKESELGKVLLDNVNKLEPMKLTLDETTFKVTQNERVELEPSTDHPITLHLHGYDVEITVTPESPVTLYLIATIPGRFGIEEHGGHGGRHSAVAYLEVHPD